MSMLLLVTGLGLCGISAALLVRTAALGRGQRRQSLDQIEAYGFNASGRTRRRLRGPSLEATAEAIGARVERRLSTEAVKEARSLLNAAGLYRIGLPRYLGYRWAATTLLAGVPLLLAITVGTLTWQIAVLSGCLGAAGWLLPKMALQRRARGRIEQVDREVPELVDLLVTTVEAGVGFSAALQLAARSIQGPLGQELRVAIHEQSMGLTTAESLGNLGERIASPAVRAFVQALLQGEALGVSIGKVLRDLALDMRKRRRQAAEERAQKAPVKMLFPLVAFILPATLIVTLGAFIVSVLKTLGSS
jgi:tight adherence protein C